MLNSIQASEDLETIHAVYSLDDEEARKGITEYRVDALKEEIIDRVYEESGNELWPYLSDWCLSMLPTFKGELAIKMERQRRAAC